MKNLILSISIFFAVAGMAKAAPITFEATVDSPRVSLDQVMQLTLTFSGLNKDLDPVSLPVLDGFSAKYVGPSTSISFENINGASESHSERSFIYQLFPNKVGHFQIPPISATVDGHTYTTQPIDVEVFQSSQQAQAAASNGGPPADQNQAPTEESLKDKILIQVSVDKTSAYVGERVPVTVRLLVTSVPMRDIQYPQFEQKGFTADDFTQPQQSSQVINGVNYDTVDFKTNIYPDRAGDVTLGPVQIAGNVLYKTGQSNPFSQDSFFGATDVFNNFFDSYATRPVTVTSQPIVIHVSPLPDQNKPDDFSGAVGLFDFHAGVAPLQVKAGDPLTFKMDVRGSGNFKSIKMPVFQAPGFKSYPPQIKDLGNEKTAELVIIPTSPDIKQVPAINFSYFDTSLNDYKTLTQGPFSIQVTSPSPDQEFKAVGFTDISKPAAAPANSFSFGKIFNAVYKVGQKLVASMWFWVSLSIALTGWVSYVLWRRFQERLENDPAFARRLKAYRDARQTLAQAGQSISTGQSKDFYGLLSKALRDYLADKWHASAAALSNDEILRRLKAASLDEAHMTQIKTLLEQSDLVCFAGASFDAPKMRADLAQAQELLGHLEKQLK